LDQNTFHLVVAIAAVVVSVSFIVQAFMFGFIYRTLKKLTATAASIQAKAEPVIDQVQGTITTVKTTVDKISIQTKDAFDKVTVETRAIAAAVSASSMEITALARHQATQLSGTLDLTTTTLERQVNELDQLVTRTQRRIEGTTIEVQETVLEPIREISALLSGVRHMLESLFRRDRKPIDKVYQDEELFI
jgi:hypothetical protein